MGPGHGRNTAGKVWRIGILSANSAAFMANRLDAMRGALRERGYVEGSNLVLDFQSADGRDDRVPEIAAEFVRQKVDLIVTHGLAPVAGKKATSTIPIVVIDSGDLVAMGVVDSLARPGGNVTGQVFFGAKIAAKRVEMLKEALPRLTQIGLLYVESKVMNMRPDLMTERAARLKLGAPLFEVAQGEAEFSQVFAALVKQQVTALAFSDHPTLSSGSPAIAQQALKHRMAAAGGPLSAEAGGLMGYGVRFPDLWASAAVFINKIIKGAKPADLPIEQPTRFHRVVNLKTARAIGITLPPSSLLQADLVIS